MNKSLLCAVLFCAATARAAPSLTAGKSTGKPGTDVDVVFTLDPTASHVSSLQFGIELPKALTTGALTLGPTGQAASKQISGRLVGKKWNIIVFGLNATDIGPGHLLTARVHIAAHTPAGVIPLRVTNIIYSDAKGATIKAGPVTHGSVTVTGADR